MKILFVVKKIFVYFLLVTAFAVRRRIIGIEIKGSSGFLHFFIDSLEKIQFAYFSCKNASENDRTFCQSVYSISLVGSVSPPVIRMMSWIMMRSKKP